LDKTIVVNCVWSIAVGGFRRHVIVSTEQVFASQMKSHRMRLPLPRVAGILFVAITTMTAQGFMSTSQASSVSRRLSFHHQNYVLQRKDGYHQNNGIPSRQRAQPKMAQRRGTGPQVDGSDRGSVLLVISWAICIWLFSIPTEFRRAVICPPSTREQQVKVSNCVTWDEWTSGISAYYRNGGGIQFDFPLIQRRLRRISKRWTRSWGKASSLSPCLIARMRTCHFKVNTVLQRRLLNFQELILM
jgi:hypothetical protein